MIEGEKGTFPVIGTGVLMRIDRVLRTNDGVFLADPFSQTVFRRATDDEIADIGTHGYVQEQFGVPRDHELMLTFDDGPSLSYTPRLLDILSRNHVPATFFDVGTNVLRSPELFQRLVREGHVVGSHTFSHIRLDDRTDLRVREELVATDHVMRSVAGYATRLFRLPYGDEDDDRKGIAQAQQMGYLQVGFDLDTNDWKHGPGDPVPVPTLDGAGHVVLLHDGGGDRTATLDLLQRLIDTARAHGYKFTTVATLVPPGYAPVSGAKRTWTDRVTWAGLWTVLVLPGVLVGWLFWFGLSSLSVISLWYLLLAVRAYRGAYRGACRRSTRQNRRRRKGRHLPAAHASPGADPPLVSVVLAAYNEERVIGRTLTGLASVEYPRLEVIAVDDGSTDGTLRILRKRAADWPALRVITQPNRGKSAALNEGFRAARGEIVVTIDADTMLAPDAVSAMVPHFEDPRVAVVAGHVKVGNRINVLTAWQSLEYLTGICVSRIAEGHLGAIMISPGACAAWRRDVVLAAGGWSHDTLAEDCDLTLAIHRLGYRVRQEIRAVAWTEAPMTVRALAKQRVRWTFGNLQAYHKHRDLVLRPRRGWLGMFVMPYAVLSIVVPLLFLPLTYVTATLSLLEGNWRSIALFTAFVVAVQAAMSVAAVVMARERPSQLLAVPIYRLIYEPLRTYVLYAAVLKALKGRAVGWYRPDRTATVRIPQHRSASPASVTR